VKKRASRKLLPLLVGAVAVSLTLAGCGGSSGSGDSESKATGPVADPSSPVTISFASWIGSTKEMKALTKTFEKKHPNINIQFRNVPADSMTQKLTTQLAGNNPPDVAYVDGSAVASFAAREALVNLDNYTSRSKVVKPDDYVKAFRQFSTYDNHLYGLPIDGESTALFYSTDMFKEAGIEAPPTTWDELQADAKKLTDPAKKRYGYAMFAPEAAYYWYPFLWQAGGEILSKDGKKVLFDSEDARKAAEFYVGLTKYAPPDYLNSNSFDGRLAFFNGQVGMYTAGSWFAGTLREEKPGLAGKWTVAPLPKGTAGCATTIASDSLVIFNQSKNKDAAWKWIEFLSEPDNMATLTFKSPNGTELPTTTALLDSPELAQAKPELKGFAEAMKCGVSNGQVNKVWPQMEEQLNKQLGSAMYGDTSVKDALSTAAAKARDLLDH
jgi:multiple sugar transport system substrate-binding protein